MAKVGSAAGQAGGAQPLHDPYESRPNSTAFDFATITANSSGGGDLLRYRANAPLGSTLDSYTRMSINSSAQLDRIHRKIRAISSVAASTVVTLTSSDSGRLLTYGGFSSAMTINLPAPYDGGWFRFMCISNSTGAVTFKPAGTTGKVVVSGDSQADGITFGSTAAAEIGGGHEWMSDGTNWFITAINPPFTSAAPTTGIMFSILT